MRRPKYFKAITQTTTFGAFRQNRLCSEANFLRTQFCTFCLYENRNSIYIYTDSGRKRTILLVQVFVLALASAALVIGAFGALVHRGEADRRRRLAVVRAKAGAMMRRIAFAGCHRAGHAEIVGLFLLKFLMG